MKLCEFVEGACKNCGARRVNARQVCGAWMPGLGDMVAAGLSAVGITKERVAAIAGDDCGCQERQEWLNRLGLAVGIGKALQSSTAPGPQAESTP